MREFSFDGRAIPLRPGQTVAGALWQTGVRTWRTTRVAGAARGLHCGIGACYDCLLTVDGESGVRACVTPAQPGAVVSSTPVHSGKADGGTGVSPAARTRPRYDVLVVGAGPAGLAAAATAALGGARVGLLDAAPRAGGQFWRHREGETGSHGYRDWNVFTGLMSLVEERVDYIPGATVWLAEAGFVLHTTAGRFSAARLVLATGAYDRALPFPGWDRPGVVTPGAAQALLKGSGVRLGSAVVVAGAGPFLLPVAIGLADAGARVVAVIEAGQPSAYLRRPQARTGLAAVTGLLAGAAGKLGEAAGYAAGLARRRIPYRTGHVVLAADGAAGGLSSVDVARIRDGQVVPDTTRRLECDALAVGYGFTANLDLPLMLGCGTRRTADGGLAVRVTGDGQTTVPGVFAAGEITGVGGSVLSLAEGELAGAAAVRADGGPSPLSERELASLRRRRDHQRAFADTMHAAHAVPAGWLSWLDDETVVCRCEEVTRAQIGHAVTELGATDARTVKLLARPGMGWCQGRVCGYATAELTAHLCGRPVSPADLTAFAERPFAAPVRLADLADSVDPDELPDPAEPD